MGMHIVIVGNPVDGFRYFGPFKTWQDAADATENLDDDWFIAPLAHENELVKGGQ